MSIHKYSAGEAGSVALGQLGSLLIPDGNTATHTGPFIAITALSDASVDVSDIDDIALTMASAADFIIPAGVTIYGRFNTFSLNSGDVIAYKG